MKLQSLHRHLSSLVALAAILLVPGLASDAHAAPLEGRVLGDAGQSLEDARVQLTPAAEAESFENGFAGWEFRTEFPNLSEASLSTEVAFDGDQSVLFVTTGRFDDGTAWLQKRFFLAPNTTYTIDLSWFQTNLFETSIGAWPVVAFAGTSEPTVEEDFTRVGRDSAAEAFTRYDLQTRVTTGSDGQIVLAFGVTVTFEVDRAHFFDFVRPSIAEVDDVVETTTAADGTFEVQVSQGIYRVDARSKGFLPDFTVPVKTGQGFADLELIKIEEIWAEDVTTRLVESDGSGEKLFIFADLTTPSGVEAQGADCLGNLLFDPDELFGVLLDAESDNGICTFKYEPADGTVERGPAIFELLDVELEGKTHAPERSPDNPLKFTIE